MQIDNSPECTLFVPKPDQLPKQNIIRQKKERSYSHRKRILSLNQLKINYGIKSNKKKTYPLVHLQPYANEIIVVIRENHLPFQAKI